MIRGFDEDKHGMHSTDHLIYESYHANSKMVLACDGAVVCKQVRYVVVHQTVHFLGFAAVVIIIVNW
jgi:hypothetical protein